MQVFLVIVVFVLAARRVSRLFKTNTLLETHHGLFSICCYWQSILGDGSIPALGVFLDDYLDVFQFGFRPNTWTEAAFDHPGVGTG